MLAFLVLCAVGGAAYGWLTSGDAWSVIGGSLIFTCSGLVLAVVLAMLLHGVVWVVRRIFKAT